MILALNAMVNNANAQVPTLDPSKTVNPATGEMAFSLPLATVKGVNGHDFPITLNYAAGIKYNQWGIDYAFQEQELGDIHRISGYGVWILSPE